MNKLQLGIINNNTNLELSELNQKIEKASKYDWLYNHLLIIIIIEMMLLFIGCSSLLFIRNAKPILKKILGVVTIITIFVSILLLMIVIGASNETQKKFILIEQRKELKEELQQEQKAKELQKQPLQQGEVQSVKLNDKKIEIKVNQRTYQVVDKYQNLTNDGLADDVSKGSNIEYKIIDDKINIKAVEK